MKNMHLKCFRISREEAMKFIQVWHFFLIKKEGKRGNLHAVETKVHVHEMSEKEIREYVANKRPDG